MPQIFTEQEFNETFALMERQPWLKPRRQEYISLLKEYPDPDHRELIIELLKEAIFVSLEDFYKSFEDQCQNIENIWQLDLSKTVFVSANSSGRISSSHEALNHLRNVAWTAPISRKNFVNEFAEAVKILTDGYSLVIVDDFVGSGGTIGKVIDWFNSEVKKKGIEINIYVTTVSGCREGMAAMTAKGVNSFQSYCVPKGISDRWVGEDLTRFTGLMTAMEETLQSKSKRGSLARLRFGWERQEAVFYRDKGNTPNNVFPLFWWQSISHSLRLTIMDRR